MSVMQASTVRSTAGVESRRAHYLLLAGQVALTVLLLAGTGAAIRALVGLYQTPLGYDPRHVLVALINLPENSHTEWADRAAFYERVREQIARVPQVESVALSTYSGVPPRSGGRSLIEIPGRDIAGSDTPILQTNRTAILCDDEDPGAAGARVVGTGERAGGARGGGQPDHGAPAVA